MFGIYCLKWQKNIYSSSLLTKRSVCLKFYKFSSCFLHHLFEILILYFSKVRSRLLFVKHGCDVECQYRKGGKLQEARRKMSINTYQFEAVRKYKEKTNLTSDDEWEDIEDGLDTSEDVVENPANRVYSAEPSTCSVNALHVKLCLRTVNVCVALKSTKLSSKSSLMV